MLISYASQLRTWFEDGDQTEAEFKKSRFFLDVSTTCLMSVPVNSVASERPFSHYSGVNFDNRRYIIARTLPAFTKIFGSVEIFKRSTPNEMSSTSYEASKFIDA